MVSMGEWVGVIRWEKTWRDSENNMNIQSFVIRKKTYIFYEHKYHDKIIFNLKSIEFLDNKYKIQ